MTVKLVTFPLLFLAALAGLDAASILLHRKFDGVVAACIFFVLFGLLIALVCKLLRGSRSCA